MKSFRKSLVALSLSVVSFLSVAQSIEIPGAESAQSHVFRTPLPFNSVSAPAPEGGNDTTYVYEEDSNEDGIGDWGIEPASPSGGECYPDYSDDGTSVVFMTPSFSILCTFNNASPAYSVQPDQNFEFAFNLQEVRGGTTRARLQVGGGPGEILLDWGYNTSSGSGPSVSLYGINQDESQQQEIHTLSFNDERIYTNYRVSVINNVATLYIDDTEVLSAPYYPATPIEMGMAVYSARSNLVFENYTFRAQATN